VKRRLLAIFLAAAVAVSLAVPASADTGICFVAVNDTIPLTFSTSLGLFHLQDTLLVPHTIFEAQGTGLTAVFDEERMTVTLYSRTQRLVFELSSAWVTDEAGHSRATICGYRNKTAFLPVALCAEHFGFRFSQLTSRDGYTVLRFSNDQSLYDDGAFIQKAENLIAYRVQRFEDTQPSQPDMPDTPAADTPPPAKPADPTGRRVFLAVTDAATMAESLAVLRREQIPAVFFLTAEEIAAQPELVRNIRAAGYPIGLTAVSGTLDAAGRFREANAALDRTLHYKTLLALLWESQPWPDGYFIQNADRARTAEQALSHEGNSMVLVSGNCEAVLRTLKQGNLVFSFLRETSSF